MTEPNHHRLFAAHDIRPKGKMLVKVLAYIRGFLLKRKLIASGPLKSYGGAMIRKKNGIIKIGKYSTLWPGVKLVATSFIEGKQAVLEIGDYTSIGDRTQIHCGESIKIGHNVLISWDVNILDHDYHAPGGGRAVPRPIVIEDEVWIGVRCLILKGVKIGKGAIIGAGAVVTKNVPPYTFVAGNPARPIKKLPSWKGTFDDNPDQNQIK